MTRLRKRLGAAADAVLRATDDLIAVAGVACVAVAAGLIHPGGPWLVIGIFLLVAATAGRPKREQG